MSITVKSLSKRFPLSGGSSLLALEEVTLTVPNNGFTCVVGPSGCGKSTLLRILAGLEVATSGEFSLSSSENPNQGHVGMVFQDYSKSLFPWFSVRKQLEVACKASKIARDEANKRISTALKLTSLLGSEQLLPAQLSGGMQQRVALARALSTQSDILLMDEPFGSVDAHTRYSLEDEVLKIWRTHPSTILMVTHDLDEAIYLADAIHVLSPRPGRSVNSIVVDLPRPRNHAETRSDPEFGRIRQQLWESLHNGD